MSAKREVDGATGEDRQAFKRARTSGRNGPDMVSVVKLEGRAFEVVGQLQVLLSGDSLLAQNPCWSVSDG